jgi:DNA segregation ATPase FtsK/SpoIIIE-like protein
VTLPVLASDRKPTSLHIPEVPWPTIRARVHEKWVANEAPHHSLIGQTRSGKTYLIVNGILPMAEWDRVLIIDMKDGTDPALQIGKPVQRMPSKGFRAVRDMVRERKPRQNWFRLIASPDWAVASEQVGEALDAVYEMGDFVVVIDELRGVTDARPPGINLAPSWERLMMRGGSRGISMINATQEPRWVRHSFYTQAAFGWLSRVEDELSQKRIAEIGSSRLLLPHLSRIQKRHWIYMDNEDPDRFWGKTMVI